MLSENSVVTVVVPSRNEERRIGACLDSVLANDFPVSRLEVLVADGSSSDRTPAIVAGYAGRYSCVRLLNNDAVIVSAGLNRAIRQARGDVIIIMGAHTTCPSSYIRICLEELSTTGADVVGGYLRTNPGGNTVAAQAIALMSQHPFGVGNSAFRTRRRTGYVDTVPYGAYRREVFDRVGYFDERLTRNQDLEFNARIVRSAGQIYLSKRLEVGYYNSPSWRALSRQAYQNGLWLADMWQVCPASFRLRHAAPLMLVLACMACAAVAIFARWGRMAGAALTITYLSAALIAALQIASRAGGRFLAPVLVSFVDQHFSYGLGSLVGIGNSCNRRLHTRSTLSSQIVSK